jgi:CheY-like chemotaxis protein
MARILVMDDDEPITRMLKKVLEGRGHEVFTAANGREGMKLFAAAQVDLVISDILMPEMDGLEALKELLRRNPDLKLIAVSGGGVRLKMDILKVAKILGASATFEKPYDLRALLAKVDEMLAERRTA